MVGVDGSPASDAAVWWAGREAALRGAVLHIVHVLTAAEMAWPSMSAPVNLIQWQREEASTVIAEAIAIAQDSSGAPGALQISSEVVFSRTVPTLVQIAEHAQMVVVGCPGRGAFERRLLGSVSLGLVHHARCPIAVIHDEGPVEDKILADHLTDWQRSARTVAAGSPECCSARSARPWSKRRAFP